MEAPQVYLVLSMVCVGALVAAVVADEVPRGVGTWSETMGNHRAVVRVTGKPDAVWAHIPWRRRDARPERKAIWVVDAATNKRVANVARIDVNRESGDIAFQPTNGAGDYFVYYMPFTLGGRGYCPTIHYVQARSAADKAWLAKHHLGAKQLGDGGWRKLPKATVAEIQAINEFHRFDPMELPATTAEMKAFLATHGKAPYLVFPEDRRYPIRMTDALPLRWVQAGPGTAFRGEAQRGEFYAFQLGVYAVGQSLDSLSVAFTDLRRRGGATIPASAMRCFNLGGTDCLGRAFAKKVSVAKGTVQPLWLGVQVPVDAAPGIYSGTVNVGAANAAATKVAVVLRVANKAIADAGDADLWRQARLRWLDSTIGLDDEVFPPYTPVGLKGRAVKVLGRQLRFGATGLPASIRSTFTRSVDRADGAPRELLAAPVRFVVEDDQGVLPWRAAGLESKRKGAATVTWKADSTARGARLVCEAKMECDGYVNYRLALTATRDADLKDIRLEIPMRADVARYMMGMGRKGGFRPQKWDWKWNVRFSNCHLWLGDVNAGLQCKLKHVEPDWSIYGLQRTGTYCDWSHDGKGGATVREEGDAVVVRAFTGPRKVKAGETLHFNFGLLITPVKALDKAHWQWRYFHAGRARPVAEIAPMGAKVINLHQGDSLNPYINYPFATADKLAAYTREAHDAGMRVKIYYTIRELSNYCAEIWALRSLGDEVYKLGKGFVLADHFETKAKKHSGPATGGSWLCEHLITGYQPAWHQRLGNGHRDASIAQQGLSRWHNYYLEGLNWLVRHVGVDGLYLDGIGYDREIMTRVRKVMLRARPTCLIDFHSGNNFHPTYGLNNCASQYMELFPCVDSLWFGEGYNYNETPDYWLVEMSGIPFGLFSEMLGGGNPWRGMVYGMSNRLGWGGDPRALWKVWDDFSIADARMFGYWDAACPVKTGHADVLATAYVRKGKTLIAVASWAKEPVKCTLAIDWKAVGLDPAKAGLFAPAIERFQPSVLFKPTDPIVVVPGRGWLLVLDEAKHEGLPAPKDNAYDGLTPLLDEPLTATALGKAWAVQASTKHMTTLTATKDGMAIEAPANCFAFAERALPKGAVLVECQIRPGTDKGASWGPGLALVWGDRTVRLNLRPPESRLGVDYAGRQFFGGFAVPGTWHTVRIRIEGERIVAESAHDGVWWQTVHSIPRGQLPGHPTAVRVGKMGMGSGAQDHPFAGPRGACSIRHLRVFGAKAKR